MLIFVLTVCIVTLATIGLGDLVAGNSPNHPLWYRIYIQLWMIFGLGWLSMIISLVIGKAREGGQRVVNAATKHVARHIKRTIVATVRTDQPSKVRRHGSFSGRHNVSVMLEA